MSVEANLNHPFSVETSDGTVIGGAANSADAVVLVAGAVTVVRGTLLVRDTNSGNVIAQIGRIQEEQPGEPLGPQLLSINPASTPVGLPPQILTCEGSGFIEGADILWGGARMTATFHDETSISTRFDIGSIQGAPGESVAVQVRNPDGRVSQTTYFTWEEDPTP